MKQLPKFSTSVIQLELKQTEYELLFIALKSFEHLERSGTPDDNFKSLMLDAQRDYGFVLGSEVTSDVEILKTSFGQLADVVMDAYGTHRAKYIELANKELHEYAVKNFEPDIYCIEPGQTLGIDV